MIPSICGLIRHGHNEIHLKRTNPRTYGGFVYIYIVTPFITDVGVYRHHKAQALHFGNVCMKIYTIPNMQKGRAWLGPARPGPIPVMMTMVVDDDDDDDGMDMPM